ncbi:deoxyribodipyrimidine photo-lyase [Schauerella aestuarii]|uniref:deoxyribodipyrimidine photo-lyase n=1 Tax=Schauerella aestuarii TaxID=2511204 RepID=UPI00136A7F5E|nr:deoxyribodipyrimidine photo-lyase [Achromobacter aestuarii]MYZ44815.1 deoxyribodipyrimidine photo-lyase [Achromobacter aestuarii]
MNAICWFRTDLRVHDNPALAEAMAYGPTLAVFVISPVQWQAHREAPVKVDFWLRNLAALQQALDALNVPLKIIHSDDWQDVPEKLAALCKAHAVTAVHANAEWGINERRRDIATVERLDDEGVSWTVHHGSSLLIPGSVVTGKGEAYKVFTPYARACRERLQSAPPRTVPLPHKQAKAPTSSDAIPKSVPGYHAPDRALHSMWPAGEDAALARVEAFANDAIAHYKTERDVPAVDGTSRISPYLAAGVISPGQCLRTALAANHGELDSGKQGITTWITELLWREFYQHLMAANPSLSMHAPMKPATGGIPWRDDPDAFDAWTAGRTGFPIIDAGMRQLMEMGWMHNRLRMLVAMLLSKNLLIDWRKGEAWFMANLIDGDLASNNGGWQWSASTGADAVPYFRIFNPETQSRNIDPQGRYIRKWVPELADLNDRDIHAPSAQQRRDAGYPEAIVDLKATRKRALEVFKALG